MFRRLGFLDALPVGILLFDVESWDLRGVNQAACDLLERSRDDLAGQPLARVRTFFGGESPYEGWIDRALAGEAVPLLRHHLVRPSGACLPVRSTLVHWQGGARRRKLIHLLFGGRADQELEMSERLSAAECVAGRMAHEARQPLASLRLALQLLARSVPTAELLPIALGELDRLARTLEEILTSTHHPSPPGAALREGAEEPQSPFTLLQESIERRAALLKSQGIRWRIESSGGSDPPRIPVQPLLREAIDPLIQNAIEAMPQGGTLTLECTVEASLLLLAVQDTGPGIPAAIRACLFQRFTSTKPTGMGMGIFLARHRIEALGGSLEALQPPGGGTRMEIRLPLPLPLGPAAALGVAGAAGGDPA